MPTSVEDSFFNYRKAAENLSKFWQKSQDSEEVKASLPKEEEVEGTSAAQEFSRCGWQH
jgi:hypothetical protein